MNTIEFSNEFDTLVDSYRRFKDFDSKEELDSLDFNEYEKSIFLTEAQQQIVIELYSGRNERRASFEATEELRACLRDLIKSATLEEQISVRSNLRTQAFKLPSDLLFIAYEEAVIQDDNAGCFNGKIISVVPVTWDSLHRTRSNPFRRPNKRRALRLDCGSSMIEVVSCYHIGQYRIEYLIKPTPIVLADFSEVTVDGFNTITECKLDSVVHRQILERAVQLAIRSKGISDEK